MGFGQNSTISVGERLKLVHFNKTSPFYNHLRVKDTQIFLLITV
jgi:hypothetical protein